MALLYTAVVPCSVILSLIAGDCFTGPTINSAELNDIGVAQFHPFFRCLLTPITAAAINIANESIGTEDISELPDKDQLILVYCRSGNRSKQASEKLVKLGYTNIVEFGGINSWPGETVIGDK